MAEKRTTSATGGEKGVKDERHDLIPREGLEAIARVYAFGATKYADHNWRKGYEWSKSYAAAMRHLVAFWSGETHDEESGLPHLAHAGFHIMALLTWLEQDGEGSQFDDRYVPTKKVDALGRGGQVMQQSPQIVVNESHHFGGPGDVAIAMANSLEVSKRRLRRDAHLG